MASDDTTIEEAFDVFENDHDRETLLLSLLDIAQSSLYKITGDRRMPEDAGSGTFISSEFFLAMLKNMHLPEREMAALQLAIVERNIHLIAALEVFRIEPDELELTDTLRRVARRILTIQTDLQQQTLSGRST